jgi:hypothetical protein
VVFRFVDIGTTSQPVSLQTLSSLEEFEPPPSRNTGGVVPWSPPQENWNPWSNCNIDEGPLAHVSIFHIFKLFLSIFFFLKN